MIYAKSPLAWSRHFRPWIRLLTWIRPPLGWCRHPRGPRDGWTLTGRRTDRNSPVFYRTFSPSGPLPCFLSLQFTIMQSRAKCIADHILPLGNLLGSGSKGGKVQQNKRGLNSIVCPTIHPYGSLSPISGLSVLKSALLGIKSAF